MSDPVIAADGNSYDRLEIRRWLRRRMVSPLTNEPITSDKLSQDVEKRTEILQQLAKLRSSSTVTKQPEIEIHALAQTPPSNTPCSLLSVPSRGSSVSDSDLSSPSVYMDDEGLERSEEGDAGDL